MNRERWTHPDLPIEVLALKLTEECGEVSKEITDVWVIEGNSAFIPDMPKKQLEKRRASLLEELEHVIFIAKTIRERVK